MKNYRLKKWYPSLYKDWVVGDIVIPWEEQKDYYHVPNKSTTIFKEEVENNPDFWELIEEEKTKPLFITEDGVAITDDTTILILVNIDFEKVNISAKNWLLITNRTNKIFFHKVNAEEYIWRNKPVFSYEDFICWENILLYERFIRKVAMVRSEQT